MSGRSSRAEKREKAPVSPCFNCADRHQGCHGECDAYMDYWLYNRRREAERRNAFLADELLIRSVEKGLAIKRAMKGRRH